VETDPAVLEFHRRLLAGDPVVSAEVAERFLGELVRDTRRALLPGDDEHMADDAAADALLGYIERPVQFDPARGSLSRYLRMSARGDLRNLRAKEISRRRRLAPADVELVGEVGNRDERQGVPRVDVARVEQLEAAALDLAQSDDERAVMNLMLDGERRTEEYARVLEIDHQPVDYQRRETKRMKDRLKKRLERAGLPDSDE